MLAQLAHEIPVGEQWLYEPKWDGFRALVFRDGDELHIQSRESKPLQRYFPELRAPLLAALPERAIIDGEIVIATPEGLAFEALLQRIHPAASRIAKLAQETPASFVVWDLLAEGDEDLREQPLGTRRRRLEGALRVGPSVHLTPISTEVSVARDWFERFEGAGLDGVVAKDASSSYAPGQRTMVKVKHLRTADCVVAGFRWHKDGPGTEIGSLLLGLYDAEGALHHVGIASSFAKVRRRALLDELAPLRENALEGHPWASWRQDAAHFGQRLPGATSRWNANKDLSWEPLRIETVCEVSYDHRQGDRFRHATHFLRWRPDRVPASCTYDQLEEHPPTELEALFRSTK